jgi:signal transduction histidine kinase
MKNAKINIYLIATILTLSVSSLLVSYFLLDEILDSSISIGVNQKTSNILMEYQEDLKKLKVLDPVNEQSYKEKFYLVQESMIVFEHPKRLVSLIKDSYVMYFLVVFITILLLSVVAAFLLSRKVSVSYNTLLKSNITKSNRLQSLEYFENWQHTAATLAHEIKNPLTPIEMMVSNLMRSYKESDSAKFEEKLQLTQNIVLDEVSRLKDMVSHFHDFSKLPTPVLKSINFVDLIKETVNGYQSAWPDLEVNILLPPKLITINVMLDSLLFKQCLLNLFQNAIEANPQIEQLKIKLTFEIEHNMLVFSFTNNGIKLSAEQSSRLFQVGFSTKEQRNNSGLGLSIVKKILLEHNGDIKYCDSEAGVTFIIYLPVESVEYLTD